MNYIIVRTRAGVSKSAISQIEKLWKTLAPDRPFQFKFVDQVLNAQYQKEERLAKILSIFSGLSIFIACIGLFGLSAYTASLRTREIGIRKIVGASSADILMLLSQDFTRMIFISFFLAIPIAWYAMETWWLSTFAYRVSVGVGVIAITGLATFIIAWLTVGYQTFKAAIANPVKSLRNE